MKSETHDVSQTPCVLLLQGGGLRRALLVRFFGYNPVGFLGFLREWSHQVSLPLRCTLSRRTASSAVQPSKTAWREGRISPSLSMFVTDLPPKTGPASHLLNSEMRMV